MSQRGRAGSLYDQQTIKTRKLFLFLIMQALDNSSPPRLSNVSLHVFSSSYPKVILELRLVRVCLWEHYSYVRIKVDRDVPCDRA